MPDMRGEQVLRERLARVVDEYNRYRQPEMSARLLEVSCDGIYVEFRGHFRCSITEWVEDFKYVAKELGIELELVDVETRPGSVVGVFKARGLA